MHHSTQRVFRLIWPAIASLFCVLVCGGCLSKTENEVIVYSALDREFSEPILNDLSEELKMTIRPKFDQESNKTVGLVTGIIQNKNRPTADVFWNNEILHTLRLQQLGLLEVYLSPESQSFPPDFVSPEHQWHGLAARARVLIVNTDVISDPEQWPRSIYDLADPKWKGKCAIARPLFGTTATHATVLFTTLGKQPAKELLTKIAQNATVEGGNKQVAVKVARGQYAFGLTDTDDAIIELEQANPVKIVFPDQGENEMGVLLIPNTLAIVKNGPNPQRARKLVDRLLKPDIEIRLANGASAQIPLNQNVSVKSRVQPPEEKLKTMSVDFTVAAAAWDNAKLFLEQTFPLGGK